MTAPVRLPITNPGQNADISVNLTAPNSTGTHRGNFVIKNEATFKEMQATKGVVLIKVDGRDFDDLIKRYKAAERDRNIENAKKFGVKDPAAILDAHEKNLVKWKVLSKDIGRDINKFAEAMNREVYSKVDPDKL